MELCARGPDGFDSNAPVHFQVISNELSIPLILVCPKDRSVKAATRFEDMKRFNLSYRIRSGTNINDDHPNEAMVVCPIDGNTLLCNGAVTVTNKNEYPPGQLHVP